MTDRIVWGAALFLLRPAYVLSEVVVAAGTTGGYSFADDTVSELGAIGCDAAYCSPRHAVMNASFLGFGVLLAVGALLLAPRLGRAATVLLVVAGISSVGVGLAPVDQDGALHTLVATPLFVVQPAALLLLARVFRAQRAVAGVAMVAAGLTALGAIVFIAVDGGAGQGVWERLALWPVLVALATVGLSCARRPGPDLPLGAPARQARPVL